MQPLTNWLITTVSGILILGVAGSIIATIVTRLFTRALLPPLRRYAERMPKSVARVFFYHMLTAAIRGTAHTSQALVLGIIMVVGAWLFLVSVKSMNAFFEGMLKGFQSHEMLSTRPASGPSRVDANAKIRQEEAEVRSLLDRGRPMKVLANALLWGATLWLPYSVSRRQIAFEFERLMQRLPGVVTKDEFRKLCRLEMDVTNRNSLEAFLVELYRLTKSYELRTIFVPSEIIPAPPEGA